MANNNGYAYTSNPRHNILQSRRFSINQSTDRKNQRDIRHCTLRKHIPQTSETKKRRTAQPRPHRKILQHQTELPKLPTDRHVNRNGTREKKNFLAKRNDQILFLTEIDKLLNETETIRSVSSINPAKNIKLNKTELLFLLRKTPEYHNETLQLYKEMLKLQKKRNLKINSLILDRNDFHELIKSDETNPLREALSEKTIFFGPQAFWSEIKQVTETTEIRNIKTETKPANISNLDLTYNLYRFGYKEFGLQLAKGKTFCIEYITTAILLQDDARLTEAIPIILAKNSYKSNTLAFLTQKFETTGKLLGLLKILHTIKPTRETAETIDFLETFNAETIPADEESILQKMRLYNAL